jgi:hypothetical protein
MSFKVNIPNSNLGPASSTFIGQPSERLFYVSTDTLYNTNSNVFGTIQAAVTAAVNYQDEALGNVYVVLPPVTFTEDFVIPRGSLDNGTTGGVQSSILVFTSPYSVSERAVLGSSISSCVLGITKTLEITRHTEFIGVSIDMLTDDTSALTFYDNVDVNDRILLKLRFMTVYGNMQTPFAPPSAGGVIPVVDFTPGLSNSVVFTDSSILDKSSGINTISIKFGSTNSTFTDNFGGHIFGYIQLTGSGAVWLNNGLLHRGVVMGETDGSSTSADLGKVTINNCLIFGTTYIHTSNALTDNKLVFVRCTMGGNVTPFAVATTAAAGSTIRLGGNMSTGTTPATYNNINIVTCVGVN